MTASGGGRWAPALVAGLAAFAVELMGGLATDLSPWYAALRKPSWQPPGWLFGPAWTVILTLAAIAAVRAWRRSADRPARQRLIAAFAVNGVLNVAWSVLFFQWRRPDAALAELVPLWLSILLLVVMAGRRDALAGWLLAPYLAWVAFAGVLNLTIVRLNAPFAGL